MFGPWETIVVSIVSRHALRKCEEPLKTLLTVYSTPADLAEANPSNIADILYGVSKYEQKAKILVKLAKAWCDAAWTDLRDLPGVSTAVVDAVIENLVQLANNAIDRPLFHNSPQHEGGSTPLQV